MKTAVKCGVGPMRQTVPIGYFTFYLCSWLYLQALEKYNIEKDIAAYIKKEFDKKYNPTWHCIVGRNFGSYVTHETR